MTLSESKLPHAAEPRHYSRQVVGLGAGGHAKVMLETVRDAGFAVAGLLDENTELQGHDILGARVLGTDSLLTSLHNAGVYQAFIGVGGQRRRSLYNLLIASGFDVISVAHRSAVVSPSAVCGSGLSVMPGAVIHADARLGDNVTINTRAVVEHDCIVANHVHVASAALLAGGVVVDDGAFIGAGATILPGVRIATRATVGAGAVVVRDVAADMVVAGNPARPLRRSAA